MGAVKLPTLPEVKNKLAVIKGNFKENPKSLGAAILGINGNQSLLPQIYRVAGLASSMAGFYHGYKRNYNSVGWGIGWFFLSALFWPIMVPLMIAEGFGKPKNEAKSLSGSLKKKWLKRKR